jgi:RND family efflux transporter MFP subunit
MNNIESPQNNGLADSARKDVRAESAPAPTLQGLSARPAVTSEVKPAPETHASASRVWLAVSTLALVLVAGLALGTLPRWRQRQTATADMNQLATPTVSVVSPALAAPGGGLSLPAEIRPWREASIYARANGYLQYWVADIGAHVQEGQLLAKIETPDLDQQLAQSRAQLVLAQANLHLAEITDVRWQNLLTTASVSEQDAAEKAAGRETAAASVEAARADVRRLEELVSFQRVIAPFAGVVTSRNTDIGDLIIAGSGGQQLFHIAQTDKLRVYVRVPEPAAVGVAPGELATLMTPERPGETFTAKVTTTAESIAVSSRTLLTELEVDNSQHKILPYSYGEIRLKPNRTDAVLVLPASTLIFHAQGLQVGVVRPDNTVELRAVQVGRDFGETVEILGGVTPGDRVIANPPDSLVNGVAVRVLATATGATAKSS